jgi:hypothetical protein
VRVTDDFNEPVAGAMVQVHRFQYGPDGRRTLAAVSTGGLRSMTDDRGEVRAFGLAAGEYVVGAQMSIAVAPGATSGSGDERAEGFVATYYPGTVSVEESVEVAVGPAQETFAQFALVPSRLSRVSGTVVDSSGRPASGAAMTLVTRMGNGASSRAIGTVSATGAFSVDGIPPGEHTLNVLAGSGGERASLPVVVGSEDLTGLRIVTTAGATVRGRIVFEGTTPPATDVVQSPRVRLTPVDGAAPPSGFPLSIMLSSTSQADRTGAFELTGATGRLLFDVTTPPGWEMTSVRYEGRDITDVPLDLAGVSTVSDVVITLTSDLTSVAGSASDGQGRRVSDYVVVVQPSQTLEPVIAARRVRALRPDAQGRFETQGLRPGRYVATALESLEDGRQFDPAFREELRRRGETFDLRDGGTVALDLTVASGL